MKENLTPYEILYRILSNKKYPSMIFGYPVTYYKLTMDCDITLKEEDIKNALLNRYNEEEVNRFLILGKDISKRGIPIYKELT